MEENVFEKGSVKLNYIKLSLPLVLTMMVSVVYSMTDTYFISWTQNTNLVAGVSLCAPIFTLLMAFGNVFGQGGSSLVSRLLGQNDRENSQRVSSFCFWGAVAFGVFIGIIMLVFQVPFLKLLGADEETMPYAREYYIVMSYGAPFLVCNFVQTNLIRSVGLPKQTMIGSMGGVVLNIILDPVFITVLGMGARGAALASIMGYAFTVIYCLIVVVKKTKNLSAKLTQIKIQKSYYGQIFGVGISAGLVNIMETFSVIILNQFLYEYGNSAIAAMGITMKVAMIAILILNGLAFGGQPIISYFYGANKKDTLQSLLRFTYIFIGTVALVLTITLEITAPNIIQCFLKNEIVIKMGTEMLRWQMLSMVCVSIVYMSNITFQATGKVVPALLMSICRQGIVFIIVIVIFANFFGYTGVIISQTVSDFISAIIALTLFAKTIHKPLFSKKHKIKEII